MLDKPDIKDGEAIILTRCAMLLSVVAIEAAMRSRRNWPLRSGGARQATVPRAALAPRSA